MTLTSCWDQCTSPFSGRLDYCLLSVAEEKFAFKPTRVTLSSQRAQLSLDG